MSGNFELDAKILIVDDETTFANLLATELGRAGHECQACQDGETALARFDADEFEVVLLDLRMPGMSGMELLTSIREHDPFVQVILLTGHGSMDSAIEAMRQGAYDYLTKPCQIEELSVLVQKAAVQARTQRENQTLRRLVSRSSSSVPIIAKSDAMRRVTEQAGKVAAAIEVPVLITGESGTGKELIAREVHSQSPLADGPFVALNCAALQESLLESEIFGHERGAFTGAGTRKDGIVEVAREGTLFLDEIGEVPEAMQAKLLRFVQFGEYRRVGGTQNHRIDVRIVAATNRDLRREIEAGRFREDLFYRLNVGQLHIPPLRERPEDIPPLVEHFMEHHSGASQVRIEPEAVELLTGYPWPGNVRELENFIRRTLIFHDHDVIDASTVRETFQGLGLVSDEVPTSLALQEVTKHHILRVLRLAEGNKTRAAKMLGIALKTLYNKLAEYERE